MLQDKSHDEKLDELTRFTDSADELDEAIFRLLFHAWAQKNMSPVGYMNVALTIRELPKLIRAVTTVRSAIPRAEVRRFLRAHQRSWIGDLREWYVLIRRRSGAIPACRWYLVELLRSIPWILWATLKRVSGLEAIWRRIGR